MGDARAFLTVGRTLPVRRAVQERIQDWNEVYEPFAPEELRRQASRCMDCGIPFCHHGCPLGNLIPEWNELVRIDDWERASERLHATNNFPEFTGRLCPAPCEAACVLGINSDPVTIKQVEVEIIDRAWAQGWVRAVRPTRTTARTVAVVGSGPAGLAAAQQLTRAGHTVTVLERADRIGGLLRYGIPEFKMEKRHLERRIAQMVDEGTRFRTGVDVGGDGPGSISADALRDDYDAVVLAGGATAWRDLDIPGRELTGIHQAMEFLPPSNRVQEGDEARESDRHLTAAGKRVVVIGGGDTGADCLGTATRQGATSVHQLEIMAQPPAQRAESTPWPTYPMMLRTSSAHEENGERVFAANTAEFTGADGALTGLRGHQVEVRDGKFREVAGSEFTLECELVLLAMGFTGPEQGGLVSQLGVDVTDRGTIGRSAAWATNVDGVFVAGDMGRGQSLIVWAIAEGRACAAAVDAYLEGETSLPAPITPTTAPQR